MTDTVDSAAIAQALEIIDRALPPLHQRELVSAAEMSDLLLDLRSVLVADLVNLEELQGAVN